MAGNPATTEQVKFVEMASYSERVALKPPCHIAFMNLLPTPDSLAPVLFLRFHILGEKYGEALFPETGRREWKPS